MATVQQLKITKRVDKYKRKYIFVVSYYIRNYLELISRKNCPEAIKLMILKLAFYIDMYHELLCSMRVDIYIDKTFYSERDQYQQIEQENVNIIDEVQKSLATIQYWPLQFIEQEINEHFMDYLILICNNTQNIHLANNIVWIWFKIEYSYLKYQSILMKHNVHQQIIKLLHTQWKYNCDIARNIMCVLSCMMKKNEQVKELLISTGVIGLLMNQATKINNNNNNQQIYSLKMMKLIQMLLCILDQLTCNNNDHLYNNNINRILAIWNMLFIKSQQIIVYIKKTEKVNRSIRQNMRYLINCIINFYENNNNNDCITRIYLLLNDSNASKIKKPLISEILPYLSDHSLTTRRHVINILLRISSHHSITALSLIKICVIDNDLIATIIRKFKQNDFNSCESIEYINILANICSIDAIKNILDDAILVKFLIDILINYQKYNNKSLNLKWETLRAINNLMYLQYEKLTFKILSFNDNAFILQIIQDFEDLKKYNIKYIKETFTQYMNSIAGIINYMKSKTANKHFKLLIKKIFEKHKFGKTLQDLKLINNQEIVNTEYMFEIGIIAFADKIEYFCQHQCMFKLKLQDLVPM